MSVAVFEGHRSRFSEEINELNESVSAVRSFCSCAVVTAFSSAVSAAELELLKSLSADSKYAPTFATLTRFDVARALAPLLFLATTLKV
jgi:coenzyme F420-reducing hydrogenase gamma subunit